MWNHLIWIIAERIVTKILDRALDNQEKPQPTPNSDRLLKGVKETIK